MLPSAMRCLLEQGFAASRNGRWTRDEEWLDANGQWQNQSARGEGDA
uniref:Uncharacterized protein n=1 Tax=Arundo donax TaxID=35708 RepID=A0A0A9GUD9_ARUDO